MNRPAKSVIVQVCRIFAVCVLGSPIACTYDAPQRSDRANLTGKVVYEGKELQGGSILVVSTQDSSIGSNGVVVPDGSFMIQNAPLGPIKIAVSTEGLDKFDPDHYVAIPSKYADPETSGITADIKAGETNTIDIMLE